MWPHYLKLGDVEIVNSARAFGYSRTAECPAMWLQRSDWGGIGDVTGGSYSHDSIELAPWYDAGDEATSRFYGISALEVDLLGSTRSGTIVEGISDGGVVSRVRRTGRRVTVRAWLTGRGRDGLNAGLTWLEAVLDGRDCTTGDCGPGSLSFFVDAPPARGVGETDDAYEARVAPLVRYLADAVCISGPIVVDTRRSTDGLHWGHLVEFILYTEIPWILSQARPVEAAPSLPVLVDDLARNLVPFPDASVEGDAVLVATNLVTNPSLETDASGWSSAVTGTATGPYEIAGRVTGELAAAGVASYRFGILGDSGIGIVDGTSSVDIECAVASLAGVDRSYSATGWAAAVVVNGSDTVVGSISFAVSWRDSGGSEITREELGERDPAPGLVIAERGLVPPAGAVSARLIMSFNDIHWRSSATPSLNSEVRLYADAFGLTAP